MATIGTFKKTGDEYTGEIVTLTVQAKKVRIVPADKRPSDSAPSHRVFVGQAALPEHTDKVADGISRRAFGMQIMVNPPLALDEVTKH